MGCDAARSGWRWSIRVSARQVKPTCICQYILQKLTADLLITSVSQEKEEQFSWGEFRRGIFNLQVWLTSTAYFAILAGLYSFGLFVSVINSY